MKKNISHIFIPHFPYPSSINGHLNCFSILATLHKLQWMLDSTVLSRGSEKAFLKKGHLSRDLTKGREESAPGRENRKLERPKIGARSQSWVTARSYWDWPQGAGGKEAARGQIMRPWKEFGFYSRGNGMVSVGFWAREWNHLTCFNRIIVAGKKN